MSYTYFDLTSAEIELLKALATAGVYTRNETNTFLMTVRGALQSEVTTVTATISGGVASITRPERIFIAEIDTEGFAAQDNLDKLEPATGSQFYAGDIVMVKATSSGRVITATSATAQLNLKSTYNIIEPTGRLGLVYVQYSSGEYQWAELFRSGADGSISVNTLLFQSAEVQDVTAAGEITINNSILPIQSARTAETLATEDMVVTVTGTNAAVTVVVDEGNGQFSIGSVTFSGTPSLAVAVGLLSAAINTAATGYTAVDDGVDTVTVTAPVGSGATANSYELAYISTSTFAATITGTFSGGVTGTDQDDTVTDIIGGQEGQMIILQNVMTGNKLTFSGANFSEPFVMQKSPIGFVVLFMINAIWTPFGNCCAQELTSTRWVDPANTSGVYLKNMHYTYPTIAGAMTASSVNDEVVILNSGSTPYNERDLLKISNVKMQFDIGAAIEYDGTVNGGIFDDSSFDVQTSITFNTKSFRQDLILSGTPIINNNAGGAGTNRCVFNVTDASTELIISGGRFSGKDRCLNISNGVIEFNNSFLTASGSNEVIKVTGGTAIFRNCVIYSLASPVVTRSGGKIIFEDCLIMSAYNNASGNGINDTAAATTGSIVFIGTNRIVTTHASSYAINATNAQNYKKMGLIYSTYGFGGTTPTDLITGVAMTMTTNTNVE